MENKICPHCGKEMVPMVDGSALNYDCKYCGYSEATTLAEGIEWDATTYQLNVLAINNPTIDQIKVLSKLTGKNFLDSKNSAKKGDIVLKGMAVEIKRIKDILSSNNIHFCISPEFPY